MLSQGEFAAFLNANATDRAELLEELTGTEIYSLISERIYDHFKSSEESLNHLKAKAEGVLLPLKIIRDSEELWPKNMAI